MKKVPTAFEKHKAKRDREVVELIRKGITRSEIAKQFNVSVEFIRQIAKRNGVDSLRSSDKIKRVIIKLLKEGKTHYQISNELNISYSKIYYVSSKSGIKSPHQTALLTEIK